ncbi:MAG TPA: ACP phosphodiesterase [Burkholderiales bacterium]
MPRQSPAMNFLAHAFLAGADPADRLGGILGDFVKGPLPAGLPAAVADGVALHRRIDSYADGHPAFRASRARVSAERRRYAGIMIDLFYDHFLALHWDEFSPEPLADFTAGTYALLARHSGLLPPRLAQIFPHMRREDWLGSYRALPSVAEALDNMSRHRLRRPNPLAGAAQELEDGYEGYEGDFRVFIRDAQRFAAAHRAQRS